MQVKGSDPPSRCDVVVVGGGIIGLATARELALRHDGLRVAVLEREAELATRQTGHSSGVIHAGVYYEPGSLKARLCGEGARELYSYCEERGIPTRRDGKLIVAASDRELAGLDELERRGHANRVPGLRRLRADEIPDLEPHAVGVAALHSPATGTVDFRRVALAFAADVESHGGAIATSCDVRAVAEDGEGVRVEYARGTTLTRALVSCAGERSDRLAVAAGAPAEPRIVPFRGAYLRLRDERAGLVRGSIYPVPDPQLPFLGPHLTRHLSGEVFLGPTALLAGRLRWPGSWRLARRHWRAGARELRHALVPATLIAEARRLVPGLRRADFVPGFAGTRAQAVGRDGALIDDFVISRTGRSVHVRNAPSPAATSALAIARLIADEVQI